MCPYVRNTRYMVLFMTIYTDQKLEKNPLMVVSEQSERAEIFALLRQKHICFFFLYRPENQKLEKKLYMIASKPFFVCVSETCDSSQYFVGESHSLSVQCVLLFVTLVIYGLIHDDLYRPETFQKLEKNPLMVMSEQSERAEIFALLRDCVRNVYVFFNRPENQKLMKKLYCERAEICGIFGSETYDSPQYSVDKSHGLSVQ